MRKLLIKWMAVTLAVVILVTSNGIAMAVHTCLQKTSTSVTLFSLKGCCAGEKKNCHSKQSGESSIRKNCCQLTLSFHKVDVSTVLKESNHVDLNIPFCHSPVHQFSFVKTSSSSFYLNKAPPQQSGRNILVKISSFLI